MHPNDGVIWFPDPGDDSLMDDEGNRVREAAGSMQPDQKEAIYRIAAQSGAITKVADQPFKSNGLYFSHANRKMSVIAPIPVSRRLDGDRRRAANQRP